MGDPAVFVGKHCKVSLFSVFKSASQCVPLLQFKPINSYPITSHLAPLLFQESFYLFSLCSTCQPECASLQDLGNMISTKYFRLILWCIVYLFHLSEVSLCYRAAVQ